MKPNYDWKKIWGWRWTSSHVLSELYLMWSLADKANLLVVEICMWKRLKRFGDKREAKSSYGGRISWILYQNVSCQRTLHTKWVLNFRTQAISSAQILFFQVEDMPFFQAV